MFGLLAHVVVYPKRAYAKFPGSERIGPHRSTVSCPGGRLVGQLFVNAIHGNYSLASGKRIQMFNYIWKV